MDEVTRQPQIMKGRTMGNRSTRTRVFKKGGFANKMQNYRHWIIWRCPSVRFLDFAKVRDSERKKAIELFGEVDEPTALATKVCSH